MTADDTDQEEGQNICQPSPVSVMEESMAESSLSMKAEGSMHSIPSNSTRAGVKRSSADRSLEHEIIDMIGKGPVRRFGPVCQAPAIQKRLERLKVEHLDAYVKIKSAYEEFLAGRKKPSAPLPEDLILRAAVIHNFDETRAVELLRRMESRYWNLTAKQLEKDLRLEICMPLPSVKTKQCQEVLYFVPARFEAKERSSSVIVSLMTYVMNAMYERFRDRRRKLCVLVNLADWKFDTHFRLDCWLHLMDLWQGRTAPLRVSQVLMVNATGDFEKAWSTIKTMANSSFVQRVHFLPDEQALVEHLANPDCVDALPKELKGQVPTPQLVREFLLYRVTLERMLKMNEAVNHSKFAPPSPTQTPRAIPETPKTCSRNSQTLFQSRVLDLPDAPSLASPTKAKQTVSSKSSHGPQPDTPALSRRSFMSRNSSMPMLARTKEERAPIIEVESESDSDSENGSEEGEDFKPRRISQFQPDAAVAAVQFQPAALAAVAAESGKSCDDETERSHVSDARPEESTKVTPKISKSDEPKEEQSEEPRVKDRRRFHRTASVPRLMGGLGLSKAKSRRGLLRPADPEEKRQGTTESDKKPEQSKGGRANLLKNMGRKALNRFQSKRNLLSRTQSVAVIGKEGSTDSTSPTNSHTSGLDFDDDHEQDMHLSGHNSKHGRGFQMLG